MSDYDQLECKFKVDGCPRVFHGQNDLDDHTIVCPYYQIDCPQCKDKVLKKGLVEHMQSTCPFRQVDCQFCENKVPLADTEEHDKICAEKPAECSHCGMIELQKNLEKHYEETCTVIEKACRLARFKCNFKGKLEERVKHEKEVITHLQLVCLFLSEEMSKNNIRLSKNMDDFMAKLREELEVPKGLYTSINTLNKELEEELKTLENKKENGDDSSKMDFETMASEMGENLLEELKKIRELQQNALRNSSGVNTEVYFNELKEEIEKLREVQTLTTARLVEENLKLKTEVKCLLTMQDDFSRIIDQNFTTLSKSYSKEMGKLRNQIKALTSELKKGEIESSFSLVQDTSIEDN